MGWKAIVYRQTLTVPLHGLWEKTLEAGLLRCLNSFRKHRVASCWITILTILLQTNQYFNYLGLLPPPWEDHIPPRKSKTLTFLMFTPKISPLHLIPLLPIKTLCLIIITTNTQVTAYSGETLFRGKLLISLTTILFVATENVMCFGAVPI